MSKVAVLILTYNEEANLPFALNSVVGRASEIWVVDSYSEDRTKEVAERAGVQFVQNRFENFSAQRNFALSLPIRSEWVFFLDADEQIPPALWDEIDSVVGKNPEENGFFMRFRFIWMGKWIKHGYYPVWIMRLFRHGKGRCEERAVNEHVAIEGKTGKLENDILHEDHAGVERWARKHLHYAQREAEQTLKAEHAATPEGSLLGSQAQRKRWVRTRIWDRLPPLVRPSIYFTYRYLLRGGFLDGKEALSYHLLQALWFQTMIDLKYLELKRDEEKKP